MQRAQRNAFSRIVTPGTLLLTVLAVASSGAAQAQQSHTTDTVLRAIVNQFAGVGGYWFTDGSATRAVGTPKFAGDTAFYVRPAHRNHMLITGGPELVSASDHWAPFSGGNSVSLTGASFRVSGERGTVGRLVPFIAAGLFYGEVHSDLHQFNKYDFVPSMALGAEFKVHRYVTLTARYRISGQISGINTDGFSLSLKVF